MPATRDLLKSERPFSLSTISLPHRSVGKYYSSPVDWRNEVLYFLLVDRFSDGKEASRKKLNRNKIAASRPNGWRWDKWSESGGDRWQGGTIKGVTSKLDYLNKLGITTIWLSPVFKQRAHLNTFHGYGIQDFLDVDPRFGTREELANLVKEAHDRGIRVLLDIIFNHSGENWVYPDDVNGGKYTPVYTPGRYPFGQWLGESGELINDISEIDDEDDAVWPQEFQNPEYYTRAGSGSLGNGSIDDPHAEHKRSDFITLRDFNLENPEVLTYLAETYMYWIALTDCDGFRIDTLKHVSPEQGRNFCGMIKEYAASLGKENFFLVGEVAGGDYNQDRYLDLLQRNLNAVLDIGEMRLSLNGVAKGLQHPNDYFRGFNMRDERMGSHRSLGNKHVSIGDDHDCVMGEKLRFSVDAASPHQVTAAVAMQLFSLGIPCIYYGTEQSLSGPEPSERKWLQNYGSNDRYLREAMFGPERPLASGLRGLKEGNDRFDTELPGFGPFGTAGYHVFDNKSTAYLRIAEMTRIRKLYPALSKGRQYLRQTSFLSLPFEYYGNGEMFAFSRILAADEALVCINPHGSQYRGADVIVDANLNPLHSEMQVIYNSAQAEQPRYSGSYSVGSRVPVKRHSSGAHYIEIRDLGPSDVLVLANNS